MMKKGSGIRDQQSGIRKLKAAVMLRVVGLRRKILCWSGLGMMLLICAGACLAQEASYNNEAEFDKDEIFL